MHRIAILPFTDISSEHDQEYFCDGLAEELIAALRNVEGMQIIPRTSSFQFRQSDVGIREIGKRLNVDCILEGSVRRAGDKIRIVLNLINTEDETPIWSERYDRNLAEVFAVQDEISQAIVQKLRKTFAAGSSASAQSQQPQNLEAYETYLRARYEWNKRTPESVRRGIVLFKEAIKHSPDYALAYVGLADAYLTLGIYGDAPPLEVMPLARQSAEHAVALQQNLAEAYTALAGIEAVFEWNWDEATRLFQRAVELDPRYATARQWFGMNCLAPLGRFAEAREQINAALEIDPHSLAIQLTAGVASYYERQYESAAGACRKLLESHPDFAMAHYFLGHALLELQDFNGALQELEKAVTLTERSAESVAGLGYAYSLVGNRIEAVQLAMELSRRSIQDYVSPVLQAQVRIGLGDLDTVFGYLENAYRTKSADLIWIRIRPTMDPVRSDPRFDELCRRLKLT